MKRKVPEESLDLSEGQEGPEKRQITDWPATDELIEAETATVRSTGDSITSSTQQPTQTGAATSITSRASRKFPSDLKTIKCTFSGCPKTFNRPARLAAHLRSHTNDRPHKCPYPDCGKDYLEEKHLAQHIKGSHTHEKKYACTEPDCGKSFVTATRLRRHAAVHEGADRFRCRGYEGCSLSFRKHQTLQRHVRTAHLSQPGYICGNDGCNSGFDTAGALRRHIEREHGELKYWCDDCGKRESEEDDEDTHPRKVGFTTLLLLQAHMRREHINCMFCDVKCGTQFDLERHIDIHHSGTTVEDRKTVACTWEGCNKKFTRVSNLNTHVKTAHEGLRFVCGQVNTFDVPDIADWNWMEEGCSQEFVSKLKLEEHVRFVHLGRKRPPKLYTVASVFAEDKIDELSGGPVLSRDITCTFPDCEARFARHYDLDRHIKNDHAVGGESLDQGLQNPAQDIIVSSGEAAPMSAEDAPFAIDPMLQGDGAIGFADNTGGAGALQTDDAGAFWEDVSQIPMQQPSATFETEWAEMRRLIDIDALVDKR